MDETSSRAETVFETLLKARWLIIAASVVAIVLTASFVPRLTRDTTADAFIDPRNEALLYRNKVKEVFGLADPIVIAVIAPDRDGVYDAATLALVRSATEKIRRLPSVDPEKVTSLATENNIVGVADGLIVEGFYEADAEYFRSKPGTDRRGAEIQSAIEQFPLYQGSLVARDGSAALIIAELIQGADATQAYSSILKLIEKETLPQGVEVHVAGEGAVSGYLSTYIDRDARRLNPIAGLIITLVLVVTFMSLRGALLPNIIVLGTVAGSIGIMAATGVDFYVITNGLIVNLIGIAVADSIHILSTYYAELRTRPDLTNRAIVARAMALMWRPITLTSLTTIAGFLALAAASVMPPVRYFGLFGALGVLIAWVYSMTLMPSLLSLWPSKRLPAPFRIRRDGSSADNVSARFMRGFGRIVLARSATIAGLAAIAVVVGLIGLSQVRINDARIENFKSSEPLYKADKVINQAMDGTYYLDVLVETAEPEGLYDPDVLRRMEALQDYLAGLPHVNGANSIVDYVKQLHRAVNEGDPSAYVIPDDPLLIAQLFFLYNASADPTDFEEEVEPGFQRALVRAYVDKGAYENNRIIVPAVQNYLEQTFNSDAVTGTATGRVTVDYYWINGIDRSNAVAVALSFGAVLVTAVVVFRSLVGGMLAATPVALAVLVVYAVMGFAGIPLGVGTSMFSAIAIGLSVDFAIHALDRIRELVREHGFTDDALIELFPTTGRALLFNFIAVAGGFGVLVSSDVPPLILFGALVAVAVSVAFLVAMTVLPALVKLIRPRFLMRSH